MKRNRTRILALLLALMLTLSLTACASAAKTDSAPQPTPAPETAAPTEAPQETEAPPAAEAAPVEKNGDIVILYTSDVHCGIDQGFGYAGLQQVRDYLIAQGNDVILVDDGDSIQGEPIGTMTKGEAIVDLMNEIGYSVAIPGNHEFDYGMDRFLALTEKADYPRHQLQLQLQGRTGL